MTERVFSGAVTDRAIRSATRPAIPTSAIPSPASESHAVMTPRRSSLYPMLSRTTAAWPPGSSTGRNTSTPLDVERLNDRPRRASCRLSAAGVWVPSPITVPSA